jgi:hypothetical protein
LTRVTQLAEAPPLVPQGIEPAARQNRRLPAGWPLGALLCLYPLWWALGIGQFAFVLFAIPMARELHRRRPIKLPPAFGFWLLYLLWYFLSLVMIPLKAPNALSGSVTGRVISVTLEAIELGSATITLLYVGNLSTREVPQRRIEKWLSVLFVVTVLGGVLALAAPYFQFTSPVERLLPHAIRSNFYARSLVHPNAAQVQNVLGFTAPRPAAPWSFTNYWANNLSILFVWFCLYMWVPKGFWRRVMLLIGAGGAVVTSVYSLNRGLWFGLIASVAFLIVSLARRGDVRSTLVAVTAIPLVIVTFFLSPLHTVISERAAHGNSNDIRAFLDKAAVAGALRSPVVGWGNTRKAIGSANSIAVGPSASCPTCGNVAIGSTGQLWQVVYSEGIVGALLYFGFFIGIWWRLRQDRSAIGAAARLIVWLTLLYSVFYNNLPVSLTLVMISLALSWRNLLPSSDKAVLPEPAA